MSEFRKSQSELKNEIQKSLAKHGWKIKESSNFSSKSPGWSASSNAKKGRKGPLIMK